MAKQLKFVCPTPKCSCETLEEVMKNIYQYSCISDIEKDKDGDVSVDYSANGINYDEGDVAWYQCRDCGFVLGDCRDEEDLWNWLEKNCSQEG